MSFGKVVISMLAAAVFGVGCRTCNSTNKDVDSSASLRPLLYKAVLTPRQQQESQAMAEFAKGTMLRLAEKPAQAQLHFLKAQKLMPESTAVLGEILASEVLAKKYGDARKKLEKIIEGTPKAVQPRVFYVELLEFEGKDDEALAYLSDFMKSLHRPNAVAARRLLGFYVKILRFADAEKALEDLMRRPGAAEDLAMRCLEVQFYFDWAEATDSMEQLKRSAVKDLPKLQGCGDVRKCRAKATQLLRALVKGNENQLSLEDVRLLCSLCGKMDCADLMPPLLDRMEDNLVEGDTAAFALMKLQSLAHNDRKGFADYVSDLYVSSDLEPLVALALCSIFENAGDFHRAQEMAVLLMGDGIDDIEDMERLYKLALKSGELENALEAFKSLPKQDFLTMYIQGVLSTKLKKPKEACTIMAKAEEWAVQQKKTEFLNVNFYQSYSAAAEAAGNVELAIAKAKGAWEQKPEDPNSCNFYGYLLADHQQRLDFAKELIEKALAAEPKNGAYLDSMAWVLYRLKDMKAALSYMEKALAVTGDGEDSDGIIRDHAGDIYEANGLHDKARYYWTESLKLNGPNAAETQKKLAK